MTDTFTIDVHNIAICEEPPIVVPSLTFDEAVARMEYLVKRQMELVHYATPEHGEISREIEGIKELARRNNW